MKRDAHLYGVQTLCDVELSLLRKLERANTRQDSWHLSHEVDCGDDLMINEIRYETDIHRGQEASTIVPGVIGESERVSSMGMCVCPSIQTRYLTYYTRTQVYIFICLNIPFVCQHICLYVYVYVYIPIRTLLCIWSRAFARFWKWLPTMDIKCPKCRMDVEPLHASSHTRHI